MFRLISHFNFPPAYILTLDKLSQDSHFYISLLTDRGDYRVWGVYIQNEAAVT